MAFPGAMPVADGPTLLGAAERPRAEPGAGIDATHCQRRRRYAAVSCRGRASTLLGSGLPAG